MWGGSYGGLIRKKPHCAAVACGRAWLALPGQRRGLQLVKNNRPHLSEREFQRGQDGDVLTSMTNHSWSWSLVRPGLKNMPWNWVMFGWRHRSRSTRNSSSISSMLSVISSRILTATYWPEDSSRHGLTEIRSGCFWAFHNQLHS